MAVAKLTASAIQCHLGTQLALNNISLTAEPGQLTGIIGTNGAGKSTLLSVLAGGSEQLSRPRQYWQQAARTNALE